MCEKFIGDNHIVNVYTGFYKMADGNLSFFELSVIILFEWEGNERSILFFEFNDISTMKQWTVYYHNIRACILRKVFLRFEDIPMAPRSPDLST